MKKVVKSNIETFFSKCKKGELIEVGKNVKPDEVEEAALRYKLKLEWAPSKKQGERVYRLI